MSLGGLDLAWPSGNFLLFLLSFRFVVLHVALLGLLRRVALHFSSFVGTVCCFDITGAFGCIHSISISFPLLRIYSPD